MLSTRGQGVGVAPESKGRRNEDANKGGENKSDSFSSFLQSATSLLQRSQDYLPWQPLALSAAATDAAHYARQVLDGGTWETRSSANHCSDCSEGQASVIEVNILPGRVGCFIDSSPVRGTYVCEVHEFSRVRDHVWTGDRIVAVDGETQERLNAITVSRMLGSRGENEEWRVTLLSGFVSYDDDLDESEPSDSDGGENEDDKSLDIKDIEEESFKEENSRDEKSREESSSQDLTYGIVNKTAGRRSLELNVLENIAFIS